MDNGDWKDHAVSIIKAFSSTGLNSVLLAAACTLTAEIIDAHLSRKYQHEADLFALKAFGESSEEYLEALKSVETDEALRRQRMDYNYKHHYQYVSRQIEELEGLVHPYVTCFLKNQLHTHRKRQIEMPAMIHKAGILDIQSSLDERIAYINDHVPTSQESGNKKD